MSSMGLHRRPLFLGFLASACLLPSCDESGFKSTPWPDNGVQPGNEAGVGDSAGRDGSSAGDGGKACSNTLDQQGCLCQTEGATRACYDGPPATRNVGTCKDGKQSCKRVSAGGETFSGLWDACAGAILPAAEDCSDDMDHDCNGKGGCADPACAAVPRCLKECLSGQTKPCYTGPAATSGVGACKPGKISCLATGKWDTTCVGEVKPTASELFLCNDKIDNDCNGLTDCQELICLLAANCAPKLCTPGASQACYTGPAGTKGVADCKAGTQVCATDGKSWGTCTGQVLPGSEAANCADNKDNDCNGFIDCKDWICSTAPACCKSGTPPANSTIYVHSSSELYTVNPVTFAAVKVGAFGCNDSITDVAVTPNGNLYGVSFSSLYAINPTSAKATYIAPVSGSGNNALTFLPDGTLLAADSSGAVKKINPSTGAVTGVGQLGNGLSSAGDLVAVSDGTMYGISSTGAGGVDASGSNVLIKVDTTTGKGTVVGPTGYASVLGLAYVSKMVLGFTASGQVIKIDPQTGAGTLLAKHNEVYWGAGLSPLVPANPCP